MSGQKIIDGLQEAVLRQAVDAVAAETVERWAMKLAVGNNGGTWDIHYTEGQKDRWRTIAREFIEEFTL